MEGVSLNITEDLIQKLKEVVPQAFTEDKLDIQRLQTILGNYLNTDAERYGLSWAGKSEAYKVLQQPTTATLLPNPEQSIDWDVAENIFIEGENLEVLKVLQKSYYGKIKMIYIDPPYNTGSDSFIYPDKFSETKEEYLKRVGEKDEDGYMMKEGLFRKNSKENGQYHSNWLNMMLPRLFLARNLLKEDGVIFVSIDDNEQANLKLLMDEIFGEENFVSTIMWKRKKEISSDSKKIAVQGEYILVYSKTSLSIIKNENLSEDYILKSYNEPNEIFNLGKWRPVPITVSKGLSGGGYSYTITNPNGKQHNRVWAYPEESYQKLVAENKVYFGVDGSAVPQRVIYSHESNGQPVSNYWDNVATNKEGKKEILELFTDNIFDTPKPTTLITKLMKLVLNPNDTILDFFAGSGTTAQAVLEQNEEDGGKRKYICVQLPEKTDEKSEAYKAGYKTIADISKARIEKVVEKIQKDRNGKLELEKYQNLGFRKYTLASSNFKIWRSDFIENEEDLKRQMELFITPEKESSTTENILWELLIKNGVPLTEQIEKQVLETGETIYYAKKGAMVFVLDKFSQAVQNKVLDWGDTRIKPKSIICLDSLFENNDNTKTNAQLKFEDNGVSFKTI
jgi:adenine-specific DNA-methyltransferase